MTQDEINWKQTIIVILLTGLVTLASSLVLDWYKSEEPKLVYSVTSSDPFEEDNSYLSIYHIVVENQGKNQISDVITSIKSSHLQIIDSKVTADASLVYNESISDHAYKFQVDYLNPNETVELSLLTRSQVSPIEPQLSIRGKGVNGIVQTHSSQSSIFDSIFVPLSISVIFMGLTTKIYSQRGEQHENLVYLCGINCLNEDAKYYSKNKTTYRIASDYLTLKALKDDNPEYKEKVLNLLSNLIQYAHIAEASKGIIYYNIARIEISRNNSEAAINALDKAKKYNKREVAKRLKVDTSFSKIIQHSLREEPDDII